MRIALFTDIYLDIPGGIPSSIKAQKSALQKLVYILYQVLVSPDKSFDFGT